MSSENEYRRFAAISLELAQRATELPDRTYLLLLAEAWLDLADRSCVAENAASARQRTFLINLRAAERRPTEPSI